MINQIIILVIGLVSFYILHKAKAGIEKGKKESAIFRRLTILLAVVEMALWFAIVYWFVRVFLVNETYYLYLNIASLLIISFFICRYFLLDFFSGHAIRIKNQIHNGDFIQAGTISGKIVQMNTLSAVLKFENEQLAYVPYFKLINSVIIRNPITKPGNKHKFNLVTKHDMRQETIENFIQINPWYVEGEGFSVNLSDENNEQKVFEILLNMGNNEFIKNLEHSIKIQFDIRTANGV